MSIEVVTLRISWLILGWDFFFVGVDGAGSFEFDLEFRVR